MGHTIEVTTREGIVHHGRFAGSQPEKILLTEGKKVEIARDAVMSIRRVSSVKGHRLNKFGEWIGDVTFVELLCLGTAAFPLAVVALTATGAVGLVGLPIVAIWDLLDRQRHDESVVLLPDPK